MRRVLLIAGAAIAGIVAVLAIVVALQPSEFHVERTATIAAPVPVVFAQINDFHNWHQWSPFAKLDPAMTVTYEGAPAGVGAIYRWAGNDQAGEGSATIVESRPDELVRMRLDFLKPHAATSTADFILEPEGDGTAVTWSLDGHNSFMFKAVHLVMDMDEMVGGMFEQGLANLDAQARAAQP